MLFFILFLLFSTSFFLLLSTKELMKLKGIINFVHDNGFVVT